MRRSLFTVIITLLLISLWIPSAWSKEPASPELTLQMAVDKALALDDSLQKAKNDVDRAEKVQDYLSDKVEYMPTGPVPSSGVEKMVIGLTQSEINYNMAKKNYEAQKDKVIMSTYSAYFGVIQAQEKVKVAEENLQNADWLRRVAHTGKSVGTVDSMGIVEADANYAAAQAALEAAQKALNDAYQKFNQLVGLWPEDRPVLVDKPELEPIKVDNLDVEVNKILAASPNVWLSQQNIDLAKLNKQLFDLTDPTRTEPYDAKEIDVKNAELTAADIKDQTDKLVRTIYYSVKQLEDNYNGAQEKVKIAEESLRIAKAKYDVGMATKTDLLKAQLSLAQARQSLVDLTSNHEVLKLAFAKPWAYAAVNGSN